MARFDAESLAKKLAPARERAGAHVGLVFRRLFLGLRTKTLEQFWFQLATMISAGVPIRQALHTLAGQHGGRAGAVFSEVAAEIDRGGELSVALERRPEHFGDFAPAMVRAAESTGGLDRNLSLVARTYERFRRVRSRVVTALLYPVVLLHLAVLILSAPVLFTRGFWPFVVSAISTFVPIYLAVAALCLLYLLVRGTRWFGELVLTLFVFGKVSLKGGLARWARTLAALFDSGVPLTRAAEIAAELPANSALRHSLREIRPALMEGNSLADALARPRHVTRMVRDMVATGEHSGSLGVALEKVAAFYEDEAEAAIRRLAVMIPLAIYLVVVLRIGWIVVSFWLDRYGPLMNL